LKDKALRGKPSSSEAWEKFASMAERFERQRNLSEAGLAFSFIEGVLVEAITNGKW
jgi:midasin (ATPase involved in ribosome maturation)